MLVRDGDAGMRVQLLGALRVRSGAGWVPVPAGQPRVVLAVLLAEAGRMVSTDRLVDELWALRPPRTAVKAIQVYVTRLRRMLADSAGCALVTRGRGYELVVDGADVDATVFERLVAAARRWQVDGRPDAVADGLAEALALWRGPALHDVPASPTVTAWAARLEQARLDAAEDRMDALLDAGRPAEAVDELRPLVDAQPLRERLWAQLMLALYRCDRRAEAAQTYQKARRALVGELGLEPGPRLRELQRAILAGEPLPGPHSAQPTAAPSVPAQLPADVAGFTGRRAHLDRLDTLLSTGDPTTTAVAISTLAGTAGVGKTALAVHWAHQVRAKFPDGQLFVDLRGYAADRPIRPIEALARFLRALGVPAEQVPSDVDEAATWYRSLLAGKKVLVLLDNAGHPDQVRPLLPGSPGCLALVTSRDRLAGLVARDGAIALTLDVLAPDESLALISRLLGADRIAAEPTAADDLAKLCGHLPLALRIVAADLARHPRRVLGHYTAKFAAGDRLTALSVPGNPQLAIRSAVDLSYAALPVPARRLFRLLSLVPGADFTAEAASAIADLSPEQSAPLLDTLAGAHLVGEHMPGRYALHDLLRLYANERATAEDDRASRKAAQRRLSDYNLRSVDAAADRLYPHVLRLTRRTPPSARTERFSTDLDASAWLDSERTNLIAAVHHTAEHGPPTAAWHLADALRGYLNLRMYTLEWRAVAEAGLAAAEATGRPRARAACHLSLGTLDMLQGRHEQAIEHLTEARAYAGRSRWQKGVAAALGGLGSVHWGRGRLDEAATHYTRALAINRRTGWHPGQVGNMHNLGLVYFGLGRLPLAAATFTQALEIDQRLGSRAGIARTMANLGDVQRSLGQLDEAAATLTSALSLAREIGDRYTEAGAECALASVHRDARRYREAQHHASAAAALAHDVGDPILEADAIAVLAGAHHHLHHIRQAVDGYQRALALTRAAGEPYGQVTALIGLAAARRDDRKLDDAADHCQAALATARHGRYRALEGQALTVLATIHLRLGHRDQAIDAIQQAIQIHQETGQRLELRAARHIAQQCGRLSQPLASAEEER